MGDSEGKGRVAMFCVVCEEEEEESTKKEGALLETSPAFQKKQLHSPLPVNLRLHPHLT